MTHTTTHNPTSRFRHGSTAPCGGPGRSHPRPVVAALQGFTLVELLVVIVILLLLLGIGVAVGPGLMDSQRRAATRSTMTNAQGIIVEYEVQTMGQVVNHLDVAEPAGWSGSWIDWGQDKPQNTGPDQGSDGSLDGDDAEAIKQHSIERFVWATFQIPDIRTMYGNLDESILTDEDGNGFLELRDRWGNKLIYVASVTHDPPDPSNADDFLPEHSVPYIASAGPDGLFGFDGERLDGDDPASPTITAEAAAEARNDNLYSFDRGE